MRPLEILVSLANLLAFCIERLRGFVRYTGGGM